MLDYGRLVSDLSLLAAEGKTLLLDPSKVSYALALAATEARETADKGEACMHAGWAGE